ncbi:MAG: hypothetical protein ACOYM9_26380, partial [Bradymonadia bacterium]
KPPLEVFPDMDRQLKLRPQARSELFPDRRSSRLPVEGTLARTGGAGVRLVGGPVPRQPRYTEEVTISVATDGCVSRSEVVVSPLWGTTQVVGVPGGDTAEAWIGLEYLNPFGPTSTSWYELPDRPAGEILDLFLGTMSTAPATEGEGIPVVYGEMTWPLCPAGPS